MTDKNYLRVFALFLFLVVALTFSGATFSAYVATPSVEGLSGGTYKPMTMPNLTGSNFAATGKIWVNGRLINIPGYMPPAPAAVQAAKTSLWLNPWLVGVSLLAWADDAGLGSDSIGWTKFVPGVPGSEVSCWYVGVHPAGGTCAAYGSSTDEGACLNRGGVFMYYSGQRCKLSQSQCFSAGYSACYDDILVYPGTATESVAAVEASSAPATQGDFDALPAPSPQTLRELAPQVGVPVDSPVYEPMDVPIGDPYTRPDGSTAEPRAKVSPQSDGKVAVDTYDKPLTSPTGEPVTNPTPEDTTETPPTETQCDKYPDSLGCARLDQPLQEDFGNENRTLSLINPLSVGGAGSCPAPLTASFLGQTVEMSFDPLCTFANSLRPLVLVMAWLSAGIIFIGGVKNG